MRWVIGRIRMVRYGCTSPPRIGHQPLSNPWHNLEVPDQASHTLSAMTPTAKADDFEWFNRCSSLTRLQRVISYMHRFIDHARRR